MTDEITTAETGTLHHARNAAGEGKTRLAFVFRMLRGTPLPVDPTHRVALGPTCAVDGGMLRLRVVVNRRARTGGMGRWGWMLENGRRSRRG